MRDRLMRRGYHVISVHDGEEALQCLAQHSFDLVLIDTDLPRLTGLDVLRVMRQVHSAVALPIVLMSKDLRSSALSEALDIGANDFVTHPINPDVLLARLRNHLRIHSSPNPLVGPIPIPSLGLTPMPPTVVTPPSFTDVIGPGAEDTVPVQLIDPAKHGLPTIDTGTVLNNKYRLIRTLGSGGAGAVFEAENVDIGRRVAVKVLHPDLWGSRDAVQRLKREGASLARLDHPNVVDVLDIGEHDGRTYLVMELLKGRSLRDELDETAPMEVHRAVAIALAVCSVLHEAHLIGIVHRDIKPDNIFLHRSRNGEVVKLLDFGIAKDTSSGGGATNLTKEGTFLGTPVYMSPERLTGDIVDASSDIYSLGVTLYEMLSGKRPYPSDHLGALAMAIRITQDEPTLLRHHVPTILPHVEAAVLECIVKDPDARPTAQRAAEGLALALAVDPVRARRERPDLAPIEAMLEVVLRSARKAWSSNVIRMATPTESRDDIAVVNVEFRDL